MVFDGAPSHRVMPEDSMKPEKAILGNRDKHKGVANTLKKMLKQIGKWNSGKSFTETTRKGEPAAMKKQEAVRLIQDWEEEQGRMIAVEEQAREYGALVLFLPCAHPMLNPTERLWRLVKVRLAMENGLTQGDMKRFLYHYLLTQDWKDEHLKNMFEISRVFRKYISSKMGTAAIPPSERG